MEKKRIYVADIHMNAGKSERLAKGKHPYEWLSRKEADRFAAFLRYLNNPDEVWEVVIIGDLMDDWVYPVDVVPPPLRTIARASINTKIVGALKDLSSENSKISVVYLPGNHDMGVTKDLVDECFGKRIKFGGLTLHGSAYRTSRLRAEHGSAHAMFNAPDPINGSVTRLPLGYFISRVVATKAHNTGDPKRHYWSYADDLLEMLGPERLGPCIFEAVLEEAGLGETQEIRMPRNYGWGDVVTAGQVKQRYAALYDQWVERHGRGLAFTAIMAEIGLLGRVADGLCKRSDTNIVVFGHSHDWTLDKDAWFVSDRIYANCGTWCDEKKPCTWVESQKDSDKNRHIVRVMDWNNGKPKKLDENHVPI
jgi:UDP-2,3-diacylglucosamine pyrophosphatase LpxH